MKKRRKPRARTNANVPAKGRLKDMADRLWSIAVRSDWNWRCAVCGGKNPDAHHVISRGHQRTRYTLRNGIALCSNHHRFDKDVSPHVNAAGWLKWLKGHQPLLHIWYLDMIDSGDHKRFSGTTNWVYYVDVIKGFREYVTPDEFERVCGVKFSQWLEDN